MNKSKLKGRRFGRLTVLRESNDRYFKDIIWVCLCSCGNFVSVPTSFLNKKTTRSCGCLRREVARKKAIRGTNTYKHGFRYTRLYRIWLAMKARCKYESQPSYKYYGAKGRTVCLEWKNDFLSFRKWAIANGYKDNLTIDRIENNGNYEPSNCQWITKSENSKKSHIERGHCVYSQI